MNKNPLPGEYGSCWLTNGVDSKLIYLNQYVEWISHHSSTIARKWEEANGSNLWRMNRAKDNETVQKETMGKVV